VVISQGCYLQSRVRLTFWCHIPRGTRQSRQLIQPCDKTRLKLRKVPGQTKIQQLQRVCVAIKGNIVRLNIPIDDAVEGNRTNFREL
jgi:hypothetical protein